MAAPSSDFTKWLKNKASTGEPVILAAGTHTLTEEVRFPQVGQHIIGEGVDRTTINYTGPAGWRALRFISGSHFNCIEGFTVSGPGAAFGGVGIGVGDWMPVGQTGSGTVTSASMWSHIRVAGFQTGIKIGDTVTGVCGSDMCFNLLKCETCTTGVRIETGNALDFTFTCPQFGQLACGIDAAGGGNVKVTGTGSGTALTGPVMRVGGGGNFEISGFRLEDSDSATGLLIDTPGNPSAGIILHVVNNKVVGHEAADRWAVIAKGNTVVNLVGNLLLSCGGIRYTGYPGANYGQAKCDLNLIYGPLTSNADAGHPLTVLTPLGNLAMNANNTVTDDPIIE